MIKEKYLKDLKALEEIALRQNNCINLSIILITINCEQNELQEIIEYFAQKDIEVINEDVELDDEAESEELDSRVAPFDPSEIDIKMDKITIDSIIKRIINKELEFDSSFQRKSGLWKKKQKSQLIESIILKIPLPAFYFDAANDDNWQIIDGLQRIGTIKEYVVDQSFALANMEFLKDLNNLKFNELPRALQRRIEETNLNAYLVNPSTPKNVKFNIFKRINTGGLVLEPQEIRNALYQGQAAKFLLELSNCEVFKEATDYSIKSDRMLDREFCLRYVAFTRLDLEICSNNIDEFLNIGMEYLSKVSQSELESIKMDFVKTMDRCRDIFGKYAFRKLNSEGRRGPVNKSLFETWSIVVGKLNQEQVNKLILQKDNLIKEFIELCANYDFLNALRAFDKTSIKTRIDKINNLVRPILFGE